ELRPRGGRIRVEEPLLALQDRRGAREAPRRQQRALQSHLAAAADVHPLGHRALAEELQQAAAVRSGDAERVRQRLAREAEGLADAGRGAEGRIGARAVKSALVLHGARRGDADPAQGLVADDRRREKRPTVEVLLLGYRQEGREDRDAGMAVPL